MPATDRDDAADDDLGERARAGVEHVQAAVRELIEAARAVLDVAEQLVEDPEVIARAAGTLGTLARDVGRGLVDAAGAAGRAGTTDDDGDGRVERIRVL
jgi:hypothetical protein